MQKGFLILGILGFLFSCNKESVIDFPIIVTKDITDTTAISAGCGGDILTNGGDTILAKGVVWSTTNLPTINLVTKTSDGTGKGMFNSKLMGLKPNTLYYVRAYATNSKGTGYGVQKQFKTLDNLFIDVQGNLYPTVKINNQVWAKLDLKVSKYKNGDTIPQVQDPTVWSNLTTGAWCYYNNDSKTEPVYGKLYNWYAVNDPRGLAPEGWNIPSALDWKILLKNVESGIDTSCIDCLSSATASGALKEAGFQNWASPNLNATNSSDFTGLANGYRNPDGSFWGVHLNAYWWSSTMLNANNIWSLGLFYDNTNVHRAGSNKRLGFAVRCIRK